MQDLWLHRFLKVLSVVADLRAWDARIFVAKYETEKLLMWHLELAAWEAWEAREALLHAELRDLEQELTEYASVHSQLQRGHEQLLTKLDLAEVELRRAQQRASELTALADAKADAARVAERRAAEVCCVAPPPSHLRLNPSAITPPPSWSLTVNSSSSPHPLCAGSAGGGDGTITGAARGGGGAFPRG